MFGSFINKPGKLYNLVIKFEFINLIFIQFNI
jgi:hypothetical protein